MKHQVEGAILELRLVAERILHQLKMRCPVFVQGDEFAVNHRVAFHAFERPGNFHVAVANDLAVAAVESDVTTFDLGDHAEAIILVLEDPAGIVERPVGQGGKHRLEPLR